MSIWFAAFLVSSGVAGLLVFATKRGNSTLNSYADIAARSTSMSEAMAWKDYTEEEFNDYRRKEKDIIVFVYPTFSIESEITLRNLDAAKIVALSGGRTFSLFLLKYEDWRDVRVRKLVPKGPLGKRPFILYVHHDAVSRLDAITLEPYDSCHREIRTGR